MPGHPASKEPRDRRDRGAKPARLDLQELRARPGCQDFPVYRGPKEIKALEEDLERSGGLEKRVPAVHVGMRASQVNLGIRVPLAREGCLVLLVLPVRKGMLEQPDSQVPQARSECKDPLDHLVSKARQDRRASQAMRALLAPSANVVNRGQ